MSNEGFFQDVLTAIQQIQEAEHDLAVIKKLLIEKKGDGIDRELLKPGGPIAKIRSDVGAFKSKSGAIG